MDMRIVRWVMAGFILFGFVSVVSGCGAYVSKSNVRDIHDKTEIEISIGDTRLEVSALLGEPLIELQSIGIEVYRKSGRDISFPWVIYPVPTLPFPEDKVVGFVLINYDAENLVTDFEADYWIKNDPVHNDFWITAGGYHFLNIWGGEPETIIGPAIPWDELAEQVPSESACTLILVMGECVMEQVVLDDYTIADLTPAGKYCSHYADNNLYGTFVRRDIVSGTHRLSIHQQQRHSDFRTVFTCESGETVFAELEAEKVDGWQHVDRFEGKITISKNSTERIVEMGHLSPILLHRGKWYGEISTTP